MSLLRSISCVSANSSAASKRNKKSTKTKSANNVNQLKPSAPSDPNNSDEDVVQNNAVSMSLSRETIDDFKSFWDIGNYKYTVKRCDNGNKLAQELAEMISERAKLEESYGKSLQSWHRKWTNHLNEDSPEYETTKLAWHAFLDANVKTADIHFDLSKRLLTNPVSKIKDWLKKNYEKKMLKFKQTKDFETEFENAEKQWLVLNEKMKKYKKDYYDASRAIRSAEEAYQSAQTNGKVNKEGMDKLEDRIRKTREELERSLKRYKDILEQMESCKPIYIKNMTEVFKKTQNFEQERMMFFKQTFQECHDLLQIQDDDRYDDIFLIYLNQINKMNPKSDLEWFSRHYGIDTQPNWPQFEEFRG